MALPQPAIRRSGLQGNKYRRIKGAKPVARAGLIIEHDSEEATFASAKLPAAVGERKP